MRWGSDLVSKLLEDVLVLACVHIWGGEVGLVVPQIRVCHILQHFKHPSGNTTYNWCTEALCWHAQLEVQSTPKVAG
jgi:hypothetical protein